MLAGGRSSFVIRVVIVRSKMKLQRVDYFKVGLLKDSSVRLLSSKGPKHQQKLVVGDQRGLLLIASIKKTKPSYDFKVKLNLPINCVEICTNQGNETIVVATGQSVRGFTVKGKTVFTLETNLVEPIQHLWTQSTEEMIVANSYVYNRYRDGKEANYFLSTDKINSLAVLPPTKVPSLTPIVACQDGTIYSLRQSTVRHRLPLDGVPSVLQIFQKDGGTSGEWIVLGTTTGQLGAVRFSRAGPSLHWMTSAAASLGGVTSIDFYDVTDSDVHQLIVGTDDGFVHVYEVNNDGDQVTHPSLIFSKNYGESVAAVRGGVVGQFGRSEIVVASQQGSIFTLTTDLSIKPTVTNEQPDIGSTRQSQLETLKAEVKDLKEMIESHQSDRLSNITTATSLQTPKVIANMKLIADEGAYLIWIESTLAIRFCLIQCNCHIQIIDVERNAAIFNAIKSQQDSPEFLATFRCQADAFRLDMKIAPMERSVNCEIRLYILVENCGTAVVKNFRLPCLCLHQRSHTPPSPTTPTHQLTFLGGFSLADVHDWISSCLPNVPDKLPSNDEIEFYFRHNQWNTTLSVQYKKGKAVFQSDNIGALAFVKEFISSEATVKNIQLSITMSVCNEASIAVVRRIHPQLLHLTRQLNDIKFSQVLRSAATAQLARETEGSGDSYKNWMTDRFTNMLQDVNTTPPVSDILGIINHFTSFLAHLYKSHWEFQGNLQKSQSIVTTSTTEQLVEMFVLNDETNEEK